MQLPHSGHRVDIQALRGLAVLLVLLYHAKLPFLPAGYLGVDIFFVISGFLITRLVTRDLVAGRFSFAGFYVRRAKRLLPAAFVTFAVTVALSPLFLASTELRDLQQQVIGAVTFTANLSLLEQTGYFAGSADLKPLLHIWSLSLEEQYYFLLPAALAITPRRWWLAGALLLGLVSFALCLALPGGASSFFLLSTRAWELLIGSVAALLPPRPMQVAVVRALFWPAIATLALLPFSSWGFHPGPGAMSACVATLVILLRAHPAAPNSAPVRALARVGDISYSLYLAHWPVFAFFNNAVIASSETLPLPWIRLALTGASLGLGYLLFRYVEAPLRGASPKLHWRTLAPGLGVPAALAIMTSGLVHATTGAETHEYARRVNYGFSRECEYGERFFDKPACRNSDKPRLLVWGDSLAMHLVPGIADSAAGGATVVQATRSLCGPLVGVAMYAERAGMGAQWARDCISFNDSVLEYLKGSQVETVVLASLFEQFLDPEHGSLMKRSGGSFGLVPASQSEAAEGIMRTVDAVRAMGKRVVVVVPPPSDGRDMSRCIDRLRAGLVTVGAGDQCAIDIDAYRQHRRRVLELMGALKAGGVGVVSFDTYLCDDDYCRTQVGDTFIYRDAVHLSVEGSVFLAQAVSLREQIAREAR